MAQTPQSEAPGGAGETAAPGAGRPPGLFGSSTTILAHLCSGRVLVESASASKLKSACERSSREADAAAQRSALDVAHLMRGGSRLPRLLWSTSGALPRGLYRPQMLYSRPPMPRPTPGRTQHDAAESGQGAFTSGPRWKR